MLAHRLPLGGTGITERLSLAASRHAAALTAGVLGVFALACALLLALPGASFVTYAPHDALIFADAAHRLDQGQVPHRDFHTPLGALTALLPYLGLRLAGSYAAAMPAALALTLAALAPLLVYVLVSRLRWAVALPVGAFLILMIAAPLIAGDVPSRITVAMWYNRLGWVLLSLLFLFWLPPRTRWPGGRRADGVLAGILVLLLVYTKITYALAALAFLGLWCALDRDARRAVAVALGICLAGAAAVELIWGIHRAYLADIAFALHAGPTLRGGPWQPVKTALKFSHEVVLVALAVVQLALARALGARDLAYVALVVGCALMIINQNSDDGSLVCLVAALAFAAERIGRLRDGEPGRPAALALAAIGLVVVFVAEPIVYRSVALLRHYAEVADRHEDPRLPAALAGFHAKEYKGYAVIPGGSERLERVVAPGLDPYLAFTLLRDRTGLGTPHLLGTTEYLFTIARGAEALAALDPRGKTIFTFDIVNPFPFVLGTPAPLGSLFCFHLDRQYSRSHALPAAAVLGGIDIALVPRFPMEYKDRDALMELYGDYLRNHFAIRAETPYWTIWTRRDAATAADDRTAEDPATAGDPALAGQPRERAADG